MDYSKGESPCLGIPKQTSEQKRVAESLAEMILSLCPSGSPTAPDAKVQAFYIRMGEIRALKALANQVLSPSQKGSA